jgi:hypothetical protein
LATSKYKNSKRIGFVDRLHYKNYSNLSIGQYLKRIVKINGKTSIRMYDNKDCINHYIELTENSTEQKIDKLVRIFRKAGCIFDGYSINPRN